MTTVGSNDGTVQQSTAGRVVGLLEDIASNEDGIAVREVARRLGIEKSAVSRILQQLEDLEMVEQSESTQRFLAGPRFYSLVAKLGEHDAFWRTARERLRWLVASFDGTCYLALRQGDHIVYQQRVEGKEPIRYIMEIGASSPLYVGAAGRAVLASMPRSEVESYIDTTTLVPFTEKTMTSKAQLRRVVAEDKKRGYSVSVGERAKGGRAIAASFRRLGERGAGALVWTCPDDRYRQDREAEIAAALQKACADLAAH